MKGCLLSRKVKLLQTLISLKTQAYRFAAASARLQSALPGRDSDAEDPATGMMAHPAFVTLLSKNVGVMLFTLVIMSCWQQRLLSYGESGISAELSSLAAASCSVEQIPGNAYASS